MGTSSHPSSIPSSIVVHSIGDGSKAANDAGSTEAFVAWVVLEPAPTRKSTPTGMATYRTSRRTVIPVRSASVRRAKRLWNPNGDRDRPRASTSARRRHRAPPPPSPRSRAARGRTGRRDRRHGRDGASRRFARPRTQPLEPGRHRFALLRRARGGRTTGSSVSVNVRRHALGNSVATVRRCSRVIVRTRSEPSAATTSASSTRGR